MGIGPASINTCYRSRPEFSTATPGGADDPRTDERGMWPSSKGDSGIPGLAGEASISERWATRAVAHGIMAWTGLLASWLGESGQIRKEAATADHRECRGSGSSPNSVFVAALHGRRRCRPCRERPCTRARQRCRARTRASRHFPWVAVSDGSLPGSFQAEALDAGISSDAHPAFDFPVRLFSGFLLKASRASLLPAGTLSGQWPLEPGRDSESGPGSSRTTARPAGRTRTGADGARFPTGTPACGIVAD